MTPAALITYYEIRLPYWRTLLSRADAYSERAAAYRQAIERGERELKRAKEQVEREAEKHG